MTDISFTPTQVAEAEEMIAKGLCEQYGQTDGEVYIHALLAYAAVASLTAGYLRNRCEELEAMQRKTRDMN